MGASNRWKDGQSGDWCQNCLFCRCRVVSAFFSETKSKLAEEEKRNSNRTQQSTGSQERPGRPPRQRRPPQQRGRGHARHGQEGRGCDRRRGKNRSLEFDFEGVSFWDYWWGILWWWVRVICVEVSVSRRSLHDSNCHFNISSKWLYSTGHMQYSVVRGMLTSRSTNKKELSQQRGYYSWLE